MPGGDSGLDTVVVNFPYYSCVASHCGNWILICVPLISHLAPQPLCNLFHNRERNRHVGAHIQHTHTHTHTHTQASMQRDEKRTHGRDGKVAEGRTRWINCHYSVSAPSAGG